MRSLTICLLVVLFACHALAFRSFVARSAFSPKLPSLKANALSPFEDDDSSEGQVMSSSGLAELKRQAQKAKEDAERKEREEAEKKAAELAAKLAAEWEEKRLQESKKIEVPVPETPIQKVYAEVEASAAKKVDTGGLSTAGGAAGEVFDFGLLIAFPIIIGTLALFFLFPIIGKDLVKDLPPVPTTF